MSPGDVRQTVLQIVTDLRVLVVGTLNMDIILEARSWPEEDGAAVLDQVSRCPGGHAGNCAAGLAALGAMPRILAAVGEDEDGDALKADLEASNVDVSRLQRCGGAGTGTVYIPTADGRHVMFLDQGANDHLAIDLLREIEAFRPQALVLFDPPVSVIAEVARLERGEGFPAVYWCPGAVDAKRLAEESGILNRADVLILNTVEEEMLAPLIEGRDDVEIVTTRGSEGAELRHEGKTASAGAFKTEIGDTVGCGDAFLAAYVIGKAAGLDPKDRLALGNGYGSMVASRIGARAGHGSLTALLQLTHPPERGMAGPRATP